MTIETLALCGALLTPSPAPRAVCDCTGPMTDSAAVRHNDAVFVGRPVRSRVVTGAGGYPMRIYTFAVTRWRKGQPRRMVEV